MDLFPRSDIFMFFVWWVSYPCVLKALIYKGFQLSQSFTLDINVTHSTCNERGGLMSFTVSVVGNTSSPLFALSVGGNISIPSAITLIKGLFFSIIDVVIYKPILYLAKLY